jgi:hypothetical protein
MPMLRGGDIAGVKSSTFRTGKTTPEGMGSAVIMQAVVIDVDPRRHTVDCVSKFDRRKYLKIPVGNAYFHPEEGEGIYQVPEVGARCMLTVPSDGTPAYVSAFLAPLDANPTESGEKQKETLSYACGRYEDKPGDFVFRGRDGNFLVIHRGGVVQIGASEVCQRIFLPLGNRMVDAAERYERHTAGGSVVDEIDEDGTNQPTTHTETYRIFAGEKWADLRITAGKVPEFKERPHDSTQAVLDELDIGKSEQIVYEIDLVQDGFVPQTGHNSESGNHARSNYRFFFDRKGGTFLRAEGALYIFSRKKIRLESKVQVHIKGPEVYIEADTFKAKGTKIDFDFASVSLGPRGSAQRPVACMGDPVSVAVMVPIPVTLIFATPPIPGVPTLATFQTTIQPMTGAITGGNKAVKC